MLFLKEKSGPFGPL